MLNPTELYLRHLNKIEDLSPDELKKLWNRAIKGDKKAKKKLTLSFLKLVIPIARRFQRSGMDLLDLIEEGNIGLMRAIDKFNPRKKVKFSTYAAYWIEQGIRRSVDEQKRTIRIPPHIWSKIKKWLKSRSQFQSRYGREPSIKEMAKKLKMSTADAQKILDVMDISRTQTSFDAPVSEDENLHIGDMISDKKDALGDMLEYLRINNQLDRSLAILSDREHNIIALRFGLNETKPHTLDQIAVKLKISKERVRQLLERSYRYIKAAIDRMKYNTAE